MSEDSLELRFRCDRLASLDLRMHALMQEMKSLRSGMHRSRLYPTSLDVLRGCVEFVDSGEFDECLAIFKQKNAGYAVGSHNWKTVQSSVRDYERQAERCRKLAVQFRLPVAEKV